ncbi:MAG: hypothetical protein RLZZ361_712 [Cyanobacteriota bacterium]|jgi:predicted O-linked N-acetylglucosamine transferase (SPINDLY family)
MKSKANTTKLDTFIKQARELILQNSFEEANKIIQTILELDSNNLESLFFKGFIESNSNNLETAKKYLLKALSINPQHIASINEIALLYARESDFDQAIMYFEKLVVLDPGYISYSNLADVYNKSNQDELAISTYQKALDFNTDDPYIYSPLGYLYFRQGDYQKALENFSKVIALNPSQRDVNLFIGEIYNKFNYVVKAIEFYKREISFHPDNANAFAQLGSALQKIGFIEESVINFKQAIELLKLQNSPSLQSQYNFLLYLLNHSPSSSMEEILEIAKNYYKDCFPEIAQSQNPPVQYQHKPKDFITNKKIKVGYISKYFFSLTGERWILDLIQHHDKSKFEIYIYHDNIKQDETTKSFEEFSDKFTNVSELDDLNLANLISSDGIDIMVDLLGHINGNRLSAFVFKPAPVQVSWFGYFGTTGLPQMDYVIADAQVVKINESHHFVEKIYRLPHSYCYFKPPKISCSIEEPPILKNGYITFGCLSRFNKINSYILDIWSRVLNSVPNSKLILKDKVLKDNEFRTYLKNFFVSRHIGEDRLILETDESFDQYFNAYNRIDIVLDTFPYGGGTTTMHALLMGVPCISLEGSRWVSRGGGPLYNRLIEHCELIAQTEEDFIKMAVKLSQDREKLIFYRSELPKKFLSSPVCDPISYTKNLEEAFLKIWQEKCTTYSEVL